MDYEDAFLTDRNIDNDTNATDNDTNATDNDTSTTFRVKYNPKVNMKINR
jgi:hypothetical protein